MKPAALFLLTLALACLRAQAAMPPGELIDRLGVQMRQSLSATPPNEQPRDDVERAVAGEIAELIHGQPGHASLTAPDGQGRTPLMQAVSGGYLLVVKALLTDASVRQAINQADAAGETAWMKAQFAPGMTLAACQPGALTLDRYPLLLPYLQRMGVLMSGSRSVVAAITQALEEAGADRNADAAHEGWLARCPNTAPELRAALARGDLQTSLINDALQRQLGFNKTYAAGLASIAQRPPSEMKFIPPSRRPESITALRCARLPRPTLTGGLNWTGTLHLRVVAATRAGVVEVADFTLLSNDIPEPYVVDHFRGALIRALSGYQCEGDHVFEQEFRFKVE
ncbi:MAG: ankyrin repeat domain-containing protein [Rubrivivax sp.]|nr:MAG: ankyrin repeat domain-containing protein [Rubrivivax sp.]